MLPIALESMTLRGMGAYRSAITALIVCVFAACVAPRSRGAECTFNRDCDEPLVCSGGLCRAQCATDRDCVSGQQCALAQDSRKNVCFDPRGARGCSAQSCAEGARCADGVCVRDCAASCPSGTTCSSDGRFCVAIDAPADAGIDAPIDSGVDVTAPSDVDARADASGDGGACAEPPGASTNCASGTLCSGRCISLNESSSHCGGAACGNSCGGRVCARGSCATWSVLDLAASSYNAYVARGALPVLAWGESFRGALGSRVSDATTPVEVVETEGAVDVETGYRNACAIIGPERRVRCWGYGMAGIVDAGTAHVRTTPTEVPSLTGAREVAVGQNFACAIRADGSVVCWGRRGLGLLGEGRSDAGALEFVWDPVTVPLPAAALPVAHISAGSSHACVVSASATDARNVWCWGQDLQSVVGRSVTGSIATPDRVARTFDSPARTVLARDFTTCVTTAMGLVYCWGNNENGVVDPSTGGGQNIIEPQRVAGSLQGVAVDAQGSFSLSWCAMQRCGAVYCWGANRFGEISAVAGGRTDAGTDAGGFLQPTRITAETGPLHPGVVSLAGLTRGGCALRGDGTVDCWGDGDRGSSERARAVSSPAWPL